MRGADSASHTSHEMQTIIAAHLNRGNNHPTTHATLPTDGNISSDDHMSHPEEDDIDDGEEAELLPNEIGSEHPDKGSNKSALRALGASFFLFGLINNVLYVIILSAALDLVPPSTPKGIIAFCNIAPALVAKVGWPYVLKGRIRYTRRLLGCCFLSVCGMFVVAAYDNLSMRLVGICLASFSSGLGELTFLQLSTTYAPPPVSGHSVGYFASGTGAAGLVGALLWWELRGLGVKTGIGISSILPFVIPLTYFTLLPKQSVFLNTSSVEYDSHSPDLVSLAASQTSNLSFGNIAGEEEGVLLVGPKEEVSLGLRDKWTLAKPMLSMYMLPLFCVYLLEYTINQGIAPTLVYTVPTRDKYPLMGRIFHSIRDYYPFWQLVYQTSVFFSRSSISLGIPALPKRLLFLPAVVQAAVLAALLVESAIGMFAPDAISWSVALDFLLIALEGICGGLAYVNVFYHINQEQLDPDLTNTRDLERIRQEREFKIGSIGFSDSLGILCASLLAVPTEIELCRAQVQRGKTLCQGL